MAGCNCGGGTSASGVASPTYTLTKPDGSTSVFLSATEAEAARARAGGGTITSAR